MGYGHPLPNVWSARLKHSVSICHVVLVVFVPDMWEPVERRGPERFEYAFRDAVGSHSKLEDENLVLEST